MQFISAPLHIMAIDAHMHPDKTLVQRWKVISQQYLTTSIARAARILPAFGLGGVCNKMLREWGLEKLNNYRYEQYLQRFYQPGLKLARQ
jgi:hypothetical protein